LFVRDLQTEGGRGQQAEARATKNGNGRTRQALKTKVCSSGLDTGEKNGTGTKGEPGKKSTSNFEKKKIPDI